MIVLRICPALLRYSVVGDSLDNGYETADSSINVGFKHVGNMVTLRSEIYAYDESNLIGDVGGFLGLFLGYSMLSIYTSIVDGAATALKRIRP